MDTCNTFRNGSDTCNNESAPTTSLLSRLKWTYTFLILAIGAYKTLQNNPHNTPPLHKKLTPSQTQRSLRILQNQQQQSKPLPLLPDRLITIFGLESSGTKFLTEALAYATGVVPPHHNTKDTERSVDGDAWGFHGRIKKRVARHGYGAGAVIEIQHLSLPWGHRCKKHPDPITMPVFLPHGCGCSEDNSEVKLLWGGCDKSPIDRRCAGVGVGKYMDYPERFFVNVTNHVRWYRERNVQATAVVVVRDDNIAFASKLMGHCREESIARTEHEWGKKLIDDALASLSHDSYDSRMAPEIVFVSYEMLMSLGGNYLRTLFDKLRIYDDVPSMEYIDGNIKYILQEMKEGIGM